MSSNFNLIPVTRKSTTTRAHADVTYGFSAKHGDLSIVLSPAFLAQNPALAVGTKVLMGFDAESMTMLIAPAAGDQAGLRTVRSRQGFPGAGTVFIAAQNLPAALPKTDKRVPLEWEKTGEDGGVVLKLSGIR